MPLCCMLAADHARSPHSELLVPGTTDGGKAVVEML